MLDFASSPPLSTCAALFRGMTLALRQEHDSERLLDGRTYLEGEGYPECVRSTLERGLFKAGTRNKLMVNTILMMKAIGIPRERVESEMKAWAGRLPTHLTNTKQGARVSSAEATVRWAFARETNPNCALMRGCGTKCPGEHSCPFVKMPGTKTENQRVVSVTLAEACEPEFADRPISFKGVPVAVDQRPQLVPFRVLFKCKPDSGNEACKRCKLKPGRGTEVTLTPPRMLKLSSLPDEDKFHSAFTRMAGIPKRGCLGVSTEVVAKAPLLLSLVQPSVNGTAEALRENKVYVLDSELDDQTPYQFEGMTVAHPKGHEAVQVAQSALPLAEGFRSFVPPDDLRDTLRLFQPDSWSMEDVTKKIAEIQLDWTQHVHRIYGREQHALMMSLPWFSPLEMMFGDRKERAWLEVLAFGDTGQGKTEIAQRFLDFFGQGTLITGKNLSVAGLLVGIDRVDGRHIMRKGVMPRYDGSLVAIDEYSAASDEVARAMTDKRSSGVARISKILHGEFMARNRLLLLANPVLGKSRRSCAMDEMPFGIQHVLPLMRSPEDVRRLDYVVGFRSSPRIFQEIHKERPPPEPPVYTQELSSLLVLWIWSRMADQCTLDFDAEEACVASSHYLSGPDGYSPSVPLYMPGDSRHKVARVAQALAGMTFSTDDGVTLRTRAVHVDLAHKMIQAVMNGPELQFDLFSMADSSTLQLTWDTFHETCLEVPRWGVVDRIGPQGTPITEVRWPQALQSMLANAFLSIHDLRTMTGIKEPEEFFGVFLRKGLMDKNVSGFKLNGRGVRVAKLMLKLHAQGNNPLHVTEPWYNEHKEEV